jgi:hypothetical protein
MVAFNARLAVAYTIPYPRARIGMTMLYLTSDDDDDEERIFSAIAKIATTIGAITL